MQVGLVHRYRLVAGGEEGKQVGKVGWEEHFLNGRPPRIVRVSLAPA